MSREFSRALLVPQVARIGLWRPAYWQLFWWFASWRPGQHCSSTWVLQSTLRSARRCGGCCVSIIAVMGFGCGRGCRCLESNILLARCLPQLAVVWVHGFFCQAERPCWACGVGTHAVRGRSCIYCRVLTGAAHHQRRTRPVGCGVRDPTFVLVAHDARSCLVADAV